MDIITISIIISLVIVVFTFSNRFNSEFRDSQYKLDSELGRVKENYEILRRQFDLVMDSYMDSEKRIRELENILNKEKVANV